MATLAQLTRNDEVIMYQALYDALGRAYWDASSVDEKDQIQGARDMTYQIITDLDSAQLAENTEKYVALQAKIASVNKALAKVKQDIANITKNLTTAANVLSAIDKVVQLGGKIL